MENTTIDIDSFTHEELLELFNLQPSFTESQLNTQFISFLENNQGIDDSHILLIKDAYYKLKNSLTNVNDNNTLQSNVKVTDVNSIQVTDVNNNLLMNNENSNGNNNEIFSQHNTQTDYNGHIILPSISETGVNTYKLGYKSSNLNPIKKDIVTKVVNIDTIYKKKTSTSSNFIYEFKEELKNVISYELVSMELPNIWNMFSTTLQNNTFTIWVYNFSDGVAPPGTTFLDASYDITIPEGSYTATEFQIIVNRIFKSIGGGLNFLIFYIDTYRGKCIIRPKYPIDGLAGEPTPFVVGSTYESPDFAFDINFDLPQYREIRAQQNQIDLSYAGCIHELSGNLLNIYNAKLRPIEYNAGFLMGFNKDKYSIDGSDTYIDTVTYDTSQNFQAYLESEGYFGDSVIKYLMLKVNDFNSNSYTHFINDNLENSNTDNILAKIPVNYPTFTVLYSTKSDLIKKEKTFFGPVNIKKMQFTLVDRFDRIIDIGSANFSMTFEFKQIYS